VDLVTVQKMRGHSSPTTTAGGARQAQGGGEDTFAVCAAVWPTKEAAITLVSYLHDG